MNMKHVFSILALSVMAVSCGKSDGGGSSDSLSSKLKAQGIYITEGQGYSSGFMGQQGGTLTVECRSTNSSNVSNQKRVQLLQEYLNSIQNKSYVKLDGRKYDTYSVASVIQQSLQALGSSSGGQYNDPYGNYNGGGQYYDPFYWDGGNGNNNYNNNGQYNQNYGAYCPSNILAQGQLQPYYNY